MAAYPIVVIDDELLQKLPESFRGDPRFQKGSTLELVPVAKTESLLEEPKGDWHRLDGLLEDGEFDTTEWKRQEREWELAHDERKFGHTRPTW